MVLTERTEPETGIALFTIPVPLRYLSMKLSDDGHYLVVAFETVSTRSEGMTIELPIANFPKAILRRR